MTDAVVGPDGALYFTVGGRGTQSELFRVTYTGTESTAPADLNEPRLALERALRRSIEVFHRQKATAVQIAGEIYPNLSHPDRFIRYAARVALEHQPAGLWQDRVLAETSPEVLITGAVALARQGDRSLQPRLIAALERLGFGSLPVEQQLELRGPGHWCLFAWALPTHRRPRGWRSELDGSYPSPNDAVNRELCILLVYLKSPSVVAKDDGLVAPARCGPGRVDVGAARPQPRLRRLDRADARHPPRRPEIALCVRAAQRHRRLDGRSPQGVFRVSSSRPGMERRRELPGVLEKHRQRRV